MMNAYFDQSARVLAGMEKMADLIGSTMGPKGRSVTFCGGDKAKTTNDGIRIAENYLPDGELEREGARRLVDAARATVKRAGDGTSLTVMLGYCMYERAIERVAAGEDAIGVARDLRSGAEATISNLRRSALSEVSRPLFESVGRVAMKGDALGAEIGGMVFDLGPDGVLMPEMAGVGEEKTTLSMEDGFRSSARMPEKMYGGAARVKLDNAMCVFSKTAVGGNVNGAHWGRIFAEWQRRCEEAGGLIPLVVVAPDVEGSVNATFMARNNNGVPIPLYIIRVDAEAAADMAIFVGGHAFSAADGVLLENYGTSQMFFDPIPNCDLYVGQDFVVARARHPERHASLTDLVARLTVAKDSVKDAATAEAISKRLAALQGKIGVIRVHALTETGLGDFSERIEDAYRASRSVWNHGVLPGGGAALVMAAAGDFAVYAKGVARVIWGNAGFSAEEIEKALSDLKGGEALALGIDGYTNKRAICKMKQDSCDVYDSALVIEEAIKNAVDVIAPLIETKYFLCHD